MPTVIAQVNDLMQTNYSYELIEPVGKNYHPEFSPELKPKEVLELGVFGGRYMTDCQNEFPTEWFKNAKLSPDFHDPDWASGTLPEVSRIMSPFWSSGAPGTPHFGVPGRVRGRQRLLLTLPRTL